MLYILLLIAFLGGLVIIKIAAGVIRILLILLLLAIVLGVGFATKDETPVSSETVTTTPL